MKLKKKYNLVALLVSLALTTGCSSHDSSKPSEVTKVTSYRQSTEELLDRLNDMYFPYAQEEYYLSDEEISSIINRTRTSECTYAYDGNVNAVVDSIMENSKEYVRTHEGYTDFFSNEKNKEIITHLLEKINSEVNVVEDMHKISSISIVCNYDEDSKYIAYYDTSLNVMFVNMTLLDTIKTNEVEMLLPYVLEHELFHVRQIACNCNTLEYDSIEYTDYPTFILESSAESHIMLYEDEFALEKYAYSEERTNESLLLLLGLFTNDTIDPYYDAITSSSMEDLFKYYDIAEDEKKELIDILYSMDGRLCRNELAFDIYGDTKVTYDELGEKIGYSYKTNLYKMLINRLITYTESTNVSLEENLVVYDIIRSIILEDTYSVSLKEDEFGIIKDYDDETIKSIYELDSLYIEFLVKTYGLSEGEIRNMEITTIKSDIIKLCMYIEDEELGLDKLESSLLTRFPTLKDIIKIHGNIMTHNYEEALEDIEQEVYSK